MKFQFDVAGVDLASVRNYSYKYYLDGHTVGSPLPILGVEENQKHYTVTANVPSEAVATPETTVSGTKIPAKTHSLEISVVTADGESPKSAKFTVESSDALPAPANLRLSNVIVPPPVLAPVAKTPLTPLTPLNPTEPTTLK